jgi:uncharacterized membrane protein
MKFLETMLPYFQGEKLEALIFILPLGLLCLVFGGWLLAEGQAGFTRGVAIPFMAMGLMLTTVGGIVGLRTPVQVERLARSFEAAPAAAIEAETVRMHKVNKAWSWYLAVWVIFGILGLSLRLLTSSDLLQGLGIALVFFAGVGLLVDGFADRRGHRYASALAVLKAER